MNGWQQVDCPACHGFLFYFGGIGVQFVLQIPCPCGQWVGVKEGLITQPIDPPVQVPVHRGPTMMVRA